MAVTLIAGLASMGSAAIAGTAWSWAAFALGAGLSLVSRALMPKPNISTQMGGTSVTTREAAASRKIVYGRARIGGNIVYLQSTGNDNKYLYLVVAVAGHEIDGFESVWFNDEKILDGTTYQGTWATTGATSTSPYVDIGFFKGNQTAADNSRTNNLVTASGGKWTNSHMLLETAYMVVRLTYDADQFANGLPNISTIIRGRKVTVPGNNSKIWSQNSACILNDYLLDAKYGLGEVAANILPSSLITANNICNEQVEYLTDVYQNRYTLDGVVDTADTIQTNIERIVGSMAGRLIFSGGKFEIHAGSYVAPAFTVDASQMVGEISVQTKLSRRNAYNGVKGVFLSEEDNYIISDYPAQISSTFAAQDGDPMFLDMPLSYTTNNVRAQRLAKLALLRSRQQESITIPFNMSALRFKVGDNISINYPRLGYSSKIFEVVGYTMNFSSDGQIVVNVQAIETASNIWDWQTADTEVYLDAGTVELYDGAVAKPPTSVQVASDSFLANDGTFNTQFKVSWTSPADAFTDRYELEYRVNDSGNPNAPYFTITTKTSPATINNLQNGLVYNIRVRAINSIGVASIYAAPSNPTVAQDTTAPSVPSSISATAGYKSISLAWTNPSQEDFNNVEIYRSTSLNGTYANESSPSGGFGAKVEHLDGGLADATTFYYKLKSVDGSGNKSAFSGVVNATTNAAAIDGTDGVNTAPVYAYKRSSSALASSNKPTTTQTWTFANASFGNNNLGNGWTGDIPTGTNDLYICAAVASSTGATDSVVAADWSAPQVLGTEGEDGTDGFNTAVVYGYKRSSSTVTDKPSTTRTWTFSNASFNNNDLGNSFTAVVPSGTNNLYFCAAVAKSQSSTDSVAGTSDWSAPQLLSSNGSDGAAGVRNAAGYVYNSQTSANAPSAPTASAYNFGTGVFTNLTSNWSRTPPINTGGDAKYWATSYYVTEATYNGTQSLNFGTVFNSVTFDGLVTFTNLNTALANDGGNVTTIDGGLITTDSIVVSKLSGDVTEVFPFSVGTNVQIQGALTTMVNISIPAPELGLVKRNFCSLDLSFITSVGSSIAIAHRLWSIRVRRKSKGASSVNLGNVVAVSSFSSNKETVQVSGNKLLLLDQSGAIDTTANGSNDPSSVQEIYYDNASNRTFITGGNGSSVFSVGDAVHYSLDRFTSAGTYNDVGIQTFMSPVLAPNNLGSIGNHSISVNRTLGPTTTATEFRLSAQLNFNVSGITVTFSEAQGLIGSLV